MNYRQKKKRSRGRITVIIGANIPLRAEAYEKLKKKVERQLKDGNVVILPAYLHVEAIITQEKKVRVEVKQENAKDITVAGEEI